MGSPPCPLFRCSGCASQPCSRQGGGGRLCSGDPHELSFLGVAAPPAPLGSPNPEQGAASPKFRLSWGIAAPELPKSPGLRSPRQPQTGRSREGKPPEEGNFPLLASHSLRATRGISVHVHLRRIPSFFPQFLLRGSQVAAPSRAPGNRELFQAPGDGGTSGACSASLI